MLSIVYNASTCIVPDWFADYGKQKNRREAVEGLREEQVRKTKREARLKKLKEQGGTAQWRAKRKVRLFLHVYLLRLIFGLLKSRFLGLEFASTGTGIVSHSFTENRIHKLLLVVVAPLLRAVLSLERGFSYND